MEENGSMKLNGTKKNDGSHEQDSRGTNKELEEMSDVIFLNMLQIESEAFEDEINFEDTGKQTRLQTLLDEGLRQELEEHNGERGKVD